MQKFQNSVNVFIARAVVFNESLFSKGFDSGFGSDIMAQFTVIPKGQNIYRFVANQDMLSRYAWDFGDGETDDESGHTVEHEYDGIGSYIVNLTVGGFGLNQSHSETINVKNPIADFTVNDDDITLGAIITFTGINQSGVTYTWDFGDGDTDITSGYIVTHTYTDVDVYTATLTVTEGLNSDEYSLNITVGPGITFEVSESEIKVGDSVTFTAEVLDGATYAWDFGDGNTDTTSGYTVEHEYNDTGTMNISLTVTKDEISNTGYGSVLVYPALDYSKVVISDVGTSHANSMAAIIASIFPTATTYVVIESSDMNNAVLYAKQQGCGVVMRATTGLTNSDITGAGQLAEDWGIIPIHCFGNDGTSEELTIPSYIDTIWSNAYNGGDYGVGLEFQVAVANSSTACGTLAGWISKLMATYSPTIANLRTLFRNLASNGGVHQNSNGYGIVDFNAVENALEG